MAKCAIGSRYGIIDRGTSASGKITTTDNSRLVVMERETAKEGETRERERQKNGEKGRKRRGGQRRDRVRQSLKEFERRKRKRKTNKRPENWESMP